MILLYYIMESTVDSHEQYIYIYIYIYSSKSLDVVQSLYFVSLYLYVPDEGSLLPKYRDCTTSNDFELYLMCCGVMLQ